MCIFIAGYRMIKMCLNKHIDMLTRDFKQEKGNDCKSLTEETQSNTFKRELL